MTDYPEHGFGLTYSVAMYSRVIVGGAGLKRGLF